MCIFYYDVDSTFSTQPFFAYLEFNKFFLPLDDTYICVCIDWFIFRIQSDIICIAFRALFRKKFSVPAELSTVQTVFWVS